MRRIGKKYKEMVRQYDLRQRRALRKTPQAVFEPVANMPASNAGHGCLL